ncbi:hypothetical protein [Paenibacillus elgii]|uniref:hypothetical protein n=1 Tax=Paenibacillus elgii TaxID=189691 RepID=UPI00203D3980|nr:hypothetical protein [Paenibacillus elgii]MCM3273516.1 hypothetical protein [Paenibacillus elgii]
MPKKPWLMSAVLSTFVIGSFGTFSPLYSVSHAEESQIASLEDYEDIQLSSDKEIVGQEEQQLSVSSATYDPSKFLTLFDRKKIVQNFRSMDKVFPSERFSMINKMCSGSKKISTNCLISLTRIMGSPDNLKICSHAP